MCLLSQTDSYSLSNHTVSTRKRSPERTTYVGLELCERCDCTFLMHELAIWAWRASFNMIQRYNGFELIECWRALTF